MDLTQLFVEKTKIFLLDERKRLNEKSFKYIVDIIYFNLIMSFCSCEDKMQVQHFKSIIALGSYNKI